jgi:hypothetical protein
MRWQNLPQTAEEVSTQHTDRQAELIRNSYTSNGNALAEPTAHSRDSEHIAGRLASRTALEHSYKSTGSATALIVMGIERGLEVC